MPGRNAVDLHTLAWPASRLGEAIEHLAQKGGLSSHEVDAPPLPKSLALEDNEILGRWIEAVAALMGLEAEPVASSYGEVDQFVRGAGPAVLRLPASHFQGESRFLALAKGGRRTVVVMGPDLAAHKVAPALVRDALCYDLEALWLEDTDRLLVEAGVPEGRRARARRKILGEQLSQGLIEGCWLLRLSPGANLWPQARHAGLPGPLLIVLGAYTIQQILSIVAWWMIGRGALEGHFDWGLLVAWALLLLTAIPFQMLATGAQSRFATRAGGLFKQRLLYGTLRLEPEEIRHQGAGQFLERVMESEAVEMLALSGGLVAILALVQLVMAAAILTMGAGGGLHGLLLLAWLAIAVVLAWLHLRRSRSWVDAYRDMVNDMVERMVGHRTRLAQEDVDHWHDKEDKELDRYLNQSIQTDQIGLQSTTVIPRGWLLLGLAGIAYAFVTGLGSPETLAVALGGVLLAFQALTSLRMGAESLVAALIAWQQVKPLAEAASRPEDAQSPSILQELPQTRHPSTELEKISADGQPILVARDVDFRYGDRSRLALRECSLVIRQGERLLLEGPSGGGKSTLAAVLAGLRVPETGLLMLWGFDRQTMGTTEWRHRVVAAPQFHENHVLTGTFAFNLLMGRRWPPGPGDLAEAAEVCQELGLGDLLERMPAGFQQMVGESGWQLSHGERSRLYIARAILQQADLVILDESFGALDPENLHRALRCVLNRAPTLLVIAHP